MSFSKLEEIRCPCGEIFEAELWNAINASEDPDLKEALKCGEINVVCCPSCGEMFYAEHFLLYHDSASELLAFVYPSSFANQATHWASKMKDDFKRAITEMMPEDRLDYEPILLFGLDSLVEIIQEDEAQNDEVSILEYSAKDLGLSLVRLRPSLARPRQLPRLLPSKPSAHKASRAHDAHRGSCPHCTHDVPGTGRTEILEGLKALVLHNEHLTRYRALQERIERTTDWSLDPHLLDARIPKDPAKAG